MSAPHGRITKSLQAQEGLGGSEKIGQTINELTEPWWQEPGQRVLWAQGLRVPPGPVALMLRVQGPLVLPVLPELEPVPQVSLESQEPGRGE